MLHLHLLPTDGIAINTAMDEHGEMYKAQKITKDTSDGSHTFNELYAHRNALFIALMRSHPNLSWRAPDHEDGSHIGGWFVAGMHLPVGDITYHLPNADWIKLNGLAIETRDNAPHWDGHSSEDVISRLLGWALL